MVDYLYHSIIVSSIMAYGISSLITHHSSLISLTSLINIFSYLRPKPLRSVIRLLQIYYLHLSCHWLFSLHFHHRQATSFNLPKTLISLLSTLNLEFSLSKRLRRSGNRAFVVTCKLLLLFETSNEKEHPPPLPEPTQSIYSRLIPKYQIID